MISDVNGVLPFTRTVIFAPTMKSPSIFADAMTPPGQTRDVVHTAQIASGDADEVLLPSNDRRVLIAVMNGTESACGW